MKADISEHSNCRIFDSDLPPSIHHTNILIVSLDGATVTLKDYEEIYEDRSARMNDI